MIRCNLNEIIMSRKIKISKISEDLGISRSTLNMLRNNQGNGVFFDTIDSLCCYLDVTPAEFFSFIPLQLGILKVQEFVDVPANEPKLYQLIVEFPDDNPNLPQHLAWLALHMNLDQVLENPNSWLDVNISLPPDYHNKTMHKYFSKEELSEDHKKKIALIKKTFCKLTEPFLHDVEDTITRRITSAFLGEKKPRFVRYSWDSNIFTE